MSEETFELLATFFDDNEMEMVKKKELFRNLEGGGYNMCTAFREIREEGINQGIQIGKDQGIQIGKVQGIQIGKDQGIQIGMEKGEERVNVLIRQLLREGCMDEIAKAVSDKNYQEELFARYHI